MPLWWRRVRQHFGISAPRMAVRTHLPWWGRGALLAALVAIIGGMWWWGFDFGQIFGGFNRKEVEARLVTAEADAAKFRARGDSSCAHAIPTLESELAMTRGAQDALQRARRPSSPARTRSSRRSWRSCRSSCPTRARRSGLQIQRVVVEPDGEDMWRYSLLVVRGGSPKDEFVGSVALQATVAAEPGRGAAADDPAPRGRPGRRAGADAQIQVLSAG